MRCYVVGYRFVIQIDHMVLKYMQSINEPTGRLARWIPELQEYDFEVHYKKGSLQFLPEALSQNVNIEDNEAPLKMIGRIPARNPSRQGGFWADSGWISPGT